MGIMRWYVITNRMVDRDGSVYIKPYEFSRLTAAEAERETNILYPNEVVLRVVPYWNRAALPVRF